MASRATQYRAVAAASFEQRAEPRRRVHLSRATVRRGGKGVSAAHLHDISIYGCRVACAEAQPVGELVHVRLAEGLTVAAEVVWCDLGFVGCRFVVPIAREVVRSLTIGVAIT